jgi:hypothetical protein
MRQDVQTNLEVHRQVATTLADLILGALLSSGLAEAAPRSANSEDVA